MHDESDLKNAVDPDATAPRGHRAVEAPAMDAPVSRSATPARPMVVTGPVRAIETTIEVPVDAVTERLDEAEVVEPTVEEEVDEALDRAMRGVPAPMVTKRPRIGFVSQPIAAMVPSDGVAGEPVPMTLPRASALGEDVQHPWGQTWFSLMQQPWNSLVLVPADPGFGTVDAAKALAEVGARYQFEPIQVVDAGDVVSGSINGILRAIDVFEGSDARLLVAVSSPLTHDAAIPSARAADGAVLVVRMGKTSVANARRTVAAIGASRFLGAIALHD